MQLSHSGSIAPNNTDHYGGSEEGWIPIHQDGDGGFLEEMTSELSCKVGAGAGQKGGWGEDGIRDTENRNEDGHEHKQFM